MNERAVVLGLPIVFGGGMIAAGVAWLVTVQLTAGEAKGEPIELALSSDCANTAISARLSEWGLPANWEGTRVRLVGPGMADDREHMREAVVAPGKFELSLDGAAVPAKVRHAGVQMSLQGQPVSLLTLETAPPAGVEARLDGTLLEIESINGGELQLRALARTSEEAMRLAADRVVWIRYPLPCKVDATLLP